MGYYTSYKLSMVEGDDELINIFRKECDGANYALDEWGDSNDSCKWYDSKKDIIEFSKKYTDAIFLLEGEGEENGDLWKLYVKDGHTQECKAKMVYPEFDKSKLLADIRESKINKVLE
jgi:hypothetical protein